MKKKILKLVAYLLSIICVLTVFSEFPQKVEAKDGDGNIVIVVDAGHGSIDGGACQNGVKESDVNWKLALALKAELQTYCISKSVADKISLSSAQTIFIPSRI